VSKSLREMSTMLGPAMVNSYDSCTRIEWWPGFQEDGFLRRWTSGEGQRPKVREIVLFCSHASPVVVWHWRSLLCGAVWSYYGLERCLLAAVTILIASSSIEECFRSRGVCRYWKPLFSALGQNTYLLELVKSQDYSFIQAAR
jgi:hypothetical protein